MTISIPQVYKDYTNVDLEPYKKVLLDVKSPLAFRFRALFALKAVKTQESVDILAQAFQDDSVLLKHEVAYVLGQMKSPLAISALETVLRDLDQDAMVRHEAAEALGAIGDVRSLPILREFLQDSSRVVRETCEISIDKITFDQNGLEIQSSFSSIDPAPALKEQKQVSELQMIMNDSKLSLFERYRAMFSLRNRGDESSVLALASGFKDESALFRHEIAYIFGQMQHPASVPSLRAVLEDPTEEPMVRHEAAEALGSIATPECLQVLQVFSKEDCRVVQESCVVGIDMYEYEQSGSFQYASL